jgi:integrase
MSVIITKPGNTRKPYTLRYTDATGQHEKSFRTKAEAKREQTKVDHNLLSGVTVDANGGRQLFGQACETYINRMAVSERSKIKYMQIYHTWIAPRFATRTIKQVADDRERVSALLIEAMQTVKPARRHIAYALILGTANEAVAARKIPSHTLADIRLERAQRSAKHARFKCASNSAINQLAAAAGIAVYLMTDCGLRPSEALAVHREDFITVDGEVMLRVSRQASRDGSTDYSCKDRDISEYRDTIVSSRVWDLVKDLPPGPVQPGRSKTYMMYEAFRQKFMRAAKREGLPSWYTPHSCRHQFASELLAAKEQPANVASWLGHKSLDVLYQNYFSELSSAKTSGKAVIDALRAA